MNIKEAKRHIQNTVSAYLAKDAYGAWEIPPEQQRPIFMVGAPGIGKTAIMRQIAQSLGINLVSYSMTHHTRQSALGLPRIVEKPWGTVTEYTMSEIIAACHQAMELTGLKQGILFLDEVNCVSETLAPSMLQFLQFKTFGQHRVPEGWVIVTAGNPPEYNRSVREFDVVMLDRLKVLKVGPDYGAWKEYAAARGVHPAVTGFLEARKDAFYLVETTPEGRQYVTARGWEDLSVMLRLYEKRDMAVDEALIGQYVCSPRICTDFAAWYALFIKYRQRFNASAILDGQADEAMVEQARSARFDERYAIVGILLDTLNVRLGECMLHQDALRGLLVRLKVIKRQCEGGAKPSAALEEQAASLEALIDRQERDGLLPADSLQALRIERALLSGMCATDLCYPDLKSAFAELLNTQRKRVAMGQESLEHAFDFCESAFSDGQELLILVTEMTIMPAISGFIGQFGCDRYFAHSRDLVFYERKKEISQRLERLDLDAL